MNQGINKIHAIPTRQTQASRIVELVKELKLTRWERDKLAIEHELMEDQIQPLAEEIEELKKDNAILRYEWDGLNKRLTLIRSRKKDINYLLDTPTLQEHIKKGNSVVTWKGAGRGIG